MLQPFFSVFLVMAGPELVESEVEPVPELGRSNWLCRRDIRWSAPPVPQESPVVDCNLSKVFSLKPWFKEESNYY